MDNTLNKEVSRNHFEAEEKYKKVESSAQELVDILKSEKEDYESKDKKEIIEKKLSNAEEFIFQYLIKEYGLEFTDKVLAETRTLLINLNDSGIIDNLYLQILNKSISDWEDKVLKLKKSLE